jgi:SAM-dependent methyltransferase
MQVMKKGDAESAKQVLQIVSAFRASRVLITASTCRLFDHLEQWRRPSDVARRLTLDRRATEILLDALVTLGLVQKERGRYRNGDAASSHLVSGSAFYLGDIVGHYATLWDRWSRLDSVVKTGTPVSGPFDHRSFIMGMHNLAKFKASHVIGALDLSDVKRALDLGGGPGTYSIALAKRGIGVTLFDMKETVAIARKVISSEKAGSRIGFLEGDFHTDDIGSGYDLILVSQILHSLSSRESISLLRKSHKALKRGGAIAIHEFLLSDDHTHPPQGALFSVNMLVNTTGGRSYAPSEISHMLVKAGFSSVSHTILEDTVVVQARKSA